MHQNLCPFVSVLPTYIVARFSKFSVPSNNLFFLKNRLETLLVTIYGASKIFATALSSESGAVSPFPLSDKWSYSLTCTATPAAVRAEVLCMPDFYTNVLMQSLIYYNLIICWGFSYYHAKNQLHGLSPCLCLLRSISCGCFLKLSQLQINCRRIH